MPICDRPSIMPFWAGSDGKMNCCAAGQTQPNSEGPSTRPASKIAHQRGLAQALHALAQHAADQQQQHHLGHQNGLRLLPVLEAPLPAAAPFAALGGHDPGRPGAVALRCAGFARRPHLA